MNDPQAEALVLVDNWVESGNSSRELATMVAVALAARERETWRKVELSDVTIHTAHHSKDFCDGYLKAKRETVAWAKQQAAKVGG